MQDSMEVSPYIKKQRALYLEKNAWLDAHYERIEPHAFYLSSVRGILRTRKAMGLVYLSMRVQRALTRLETARNGAEMALV